MKATLKLIWILFLPLLTYGQMKSDIQSLESYIAIKGQSNVNTFGLKASWNNPETYTTLTEPHLLNLEVPFKDFKTKKRIIYNDFLSMVQYEKYPDLKISFSTSTIKNPLINTIECSITLSGVTKKFNVSIYCFQVGDKRLYIKGKNTINLNSFNLEPPKKLLNLIKIKEEIEVNFALFINEQDLVLSSVGF